MSDQIEVYIQSATTNWTDSHGTSGWLKRSTATLKDIFEYLVHCQERLMAIVEEITDYGPEKKILVLQALRRIFRVTLISLSPLWMKPARKPLEYLVIDVVCSYLIDYSISKYKTGLWGKPTDQKLPNVPGPEILGSSGNG